jgi:very-short-patch-repair endonuclease
MSTAEPAALREPVDHRFMTSVHNSRQGAAKSRQAREWLKLRRSVDSSEGVARVSTLRAQGHSRYTIARAVDGRRLERVRKDWVALPDADPELIAAARWGVVLTCITVARRLGLWVLHEDRCHVAAAPNSTGPKPPLATVHWAAPVVPRHPDHVVDSVTNALVVVAMCQPHEAALAIWESALRQGVVARAQLDRMKLPAVAASLLEQAQPFRDSGLETIFLDRLRWLGVRILPQAWLLGHPVDALIGERLVVQIDGGHHVGDQRTSDIAHDALLTLHGYHVIRVGYQQVMDDWPFVQGVIMQAVAQGLHLAK